MIGPELLDGYPKTVYIVDELYIDGTRSEGILKTNYSSIDDFQKDRMNFRECRRWNCRLCCFLRTLEE